MKGQRRAICGELPGRRGDRAGGAATGPEDADIAAAAVARVFGRAQAAAQRSGRESDCALTERSAIALSVTVYNQCLTTESDDRVMCLSWAIHELCVSTVSDHGMHGTTNFWGK